MPPRAAVLSRLPQRWPGKQIEVHGVMFLLPSFMMDNRSNWKLQWSPVQKDRGTGSLLFVYFSSFNQLNGSHVVHSLIIPSAFPGVWNLEAVVSWKFLGIPLALLGSTVQVSFKSYFLRVWSCFFSFKITLRSLISVDGHCSSIVL